MYSQLYQVDVKPERREDYRRLVRQLAEESLREEPGTLRFYCVQDESDENRFYIFESYTDREAMQAHMQGAVVQRIAPHVGPTHAAPPVKLGAGFDVELSDQP